MLPTLGRGLRLALILGLSTTYVAWHSRDAFAKKHASDDDSGGDDDDSASDDDDSGSKAGDSDSDSDEDNADDKDQPLVTAGGLFTMQTYPVNEIQRPLTMTQGIKQVRFSLGTDLSAKGAFNSVGVNVEGTYGLKDNFSLIGGITSAYNFKQFAIYGGFEGSLYYDVIDIRLAANIHRFAYPRFCNNGDPDQPVTCDANSAGLPDGNYDAGGTQFSIDLGFPFRYPFTPQIAVVALQTLISIDFNGSTRGDPMNRPMGAPVYCSGVGTDPTTMMPLAADPNNCIENGAKPDLNPSLGFATNPIPQLSVVVFGQLRIPDFDTSAGNFRVPVTARVEFSPTQKFDIGLEFTLLNIKPPDPQSPIDNRFLSLFSQARF